MLAMRPRAAAALGGLLLAFALTATPATPAPLMARPGDPDRVYLLRGGHATADAAAAAALSAAGFAVDSGVQTPDFTGAEAELADYDLVVALYNNNVSRNLSTAGAAALAAYVNGGGGLVAGEWLTRKSEALDLTALAGILPASPCGTSAAGSTTLTQLAPNPLINAGLPVSFAVALANHDGSEGCLNPRAEAVTLYASSNGGGQSGAAGLVVWNPPGTEGRVATFSTLLSAAELANPNMRRLLQNTALWVAGARDTTAPTIQRFVLSGAGTLTASRDVTLDIRANDRGGARLGSLYVVEYGYSGNAAAPWRVIQRSGWLTWGNGANRSLSWRLADEAGVHYLQIFVADRAGNVSSSPGLDFISYQPASASVAAGQQRIYRLSPAAGRAVTVRMNVLAGNPDLYAFSLGRAGLDFAPWSDLPVEQVSFSPDGGVYQIEVEGHAAGSYTLSVAAGPGRADIAVGSPRVRRRTSIITLRSVEPQPGDASLPPAPAEEGPAFVAQIIYLPLLQR